MKIVIKINFSRRKAYLFLLQKCSTNYEGKEGFDLALYLKLSVFVTTKDTSITQDGLDSILNNSDLD